MSVRRLLPAALLVGLVTAAVNADETPTRIFHIGIVAGTPRSSPERVAFEDRLRELDPRAQLLSALVDTAC